MTAFDPRSLLYGQLDPARAQALTADALARCDDGELYLQFSASETFAFDDGRLKTADYSRDAGFGLRGVSGEMTGFAHANEISEAAIRRAGETLQLLDPAKGAHSAPPRQNNRHLYTDLSPLDGLPFAAKVKLLETIDAAARARDPRVARLPPAWPRAGRWSRSSAPMASLPPMCGPWCGSTSASWLNKTGGAKPAASGSAGAAL
jgi:TldD protein